jgi:hypothetical protein
MTEAERKEYRALKYARAEQGFFTPEQKERWDSLHILQGREFTKKIEILEEKRLARLN